MGNPYPKLLIDLWDINKKITPALLQVLTPEHTAAIHQAIDELPQKDDGRMILVIERYYGIRRDKATLAKIGQDLLQPVTGSWVRVIKEKGLTLLRVNPTLQPVALSLFEAGIESCSLETTASLPSPELMSSLQHLAAAGKQPLTKELQAIPIVILGLSEPVRTCLQNDSINTLGELVKLSSGELMRTPGFGCQYLQEVKARLTAIGLYLAQ